MSEFLPPIDGREENGLSKFGHDPTPEEFAQAILESVASGSDGISVDFNIYPSREYIEQVRSILAANGHTFTLPGNN